MIIILSINAKINICLKIKIVTTLKKKINMIYFPANLGLNGEIREKVEYFLIIINIK
jgi:hypothetical protein